MKKNEFKIPKKFNIFGHEFKVMWDETLIETKERLGEVDYSALEIRLQPNTTKLEKETELKLGKSQIEQTFFHELTHVLFYFAGYEKDSNDEKKVELVSHLLHQAFTSALIDDKFSSEINEVFISQVDPNINVKSEIKG